MLVSLFFNEPRSRNVRGDDELDVKLTMGTASVLCDSTLVRTTPGDVVLSYAMMSYIALKQGLKP